MLHDLESQKFRKEKLISGILKISQISGTTFLRNQLWISIIINKLHRLDKYSIGYEIQQMALDFNYYFYCSRITGLPQCCVQKIFWYKKKFFLTFVASGHFNEEFLF